MKITISTDDGYFTRLLSGITPRTNVYAIALEVIAAIQELDSIERTRKEGNKKP